MEVTTSRTEVVRLTPKVRLVTQIVHEKPF